MSVWHKQTCLHSNAKLLCHLPLPFCCDHCLTAFMGAGAVQIYTGGIENVVKAWDLRRNAVIFSMSGHSDTITSMRVSPDSGGDFLLTNAMVSHLYSLDTSPDPVFLVSQNSWAYSRLCTNATYQLMHQEESLSKSDFVLHREMCKHLRPAQSFKLSLLCFCRTTP